MSFKLTEYLLNMALKLAPYYIIFCYVTVFNNPCNTWNTDIFKFSNYHIPSLKKGLFGELGTLRLLILKPLLIVV